MFAGVWEDWSHGATVWQTYSILTTVPNKEIAAVHDRMPVILQKEDWQQWLEADRREDIEPLLTPYGDDALEMFEVSKDVNVVRVSHERLIAPINSK